MPADGQAKLRVFHASPSAPAEVDVAVTDGPILVEALAYPEATGYLTVDAGTYPLEIRAAGDEMAALTLEATLEAGQNYTAIAMDDPEAEVPVQVIVATEAMAELAEHGHDGSRRRRSRSSAWRSWAWRSSTALPLAARPSRA